MVGRPNITFAVFDLSLYDATIAFLYTLLFFTFILINMKESMHVEYPATETNETVYCWIQIFVARFG